MVKIRDNLVEKKNREIRSNQRFSLFAVVVICVLAFIFYLSNFVLIKIYVSGPSMENTLYNGDIVLANTSYGKLKTGDVVIIEKPGEDYLIIKRVIAVDKCTVEIIDGNVYVDGEKLIEPYVDGAYTRPYYPQKTKWELKDGEVFYLGDNRSVSADSRQNGPCDKSMIMGKVFDFSFNRDGVLFAYFNR